MTQSSSNPDSSDHIPSIVPSRPPSRQSTRVITPVKSHPLYIRPNKDARRSLATHSQSQSQSTNRTATHTQTTPLKSPRQRRVYRRNSGSQSKGRNRPSLAARSQKRKRGVINNSDKSSEANSDPEIAVMDLAQDSDNHNSKLKPTGKRTQGVAVTEFDDVALYFESPIRAVGVKLFYKCRWCEKTYKRGEHTRSNLRVHRDGGVGRSACPGRNKVIETGGANLPKTWKDTQQNQGNLLNRFFKTVPFDNQVLNQLLVMWLIRSALPWKQLEDALLHISFGYARRGVKLFSRTWAATEAHRLYLNLKQKVMDKLYAIKSKISLIHDVWTTKGNRHTFMGISISYISDDWVFCVSHLALKYISYTHKAQTTDSGSNNRTVTAEVDRLVSKKGITNLNLIDNHIRCFCHKLGLILAAGLHEIDVETAALILEKHTTLGFVPGLETITEDAPESPVGPSNPFHSDDEAPAEINPARHDEDNQELSNDDEPDGNAPNDVNSFATILRNVDYVIQQITSSAAKRSEFNVWAKKLDYDGRSLIAGYGIRWNIKWQSRDRAYEARYVIGKLLELERDRHLREGGKHFYQEVDIRWSDWEIVKRLNDILSEFYFITKTMEGDHSSASLMLAEYQYIRRFLNSRLTPGLEPEFTAMIRKMLTKTETYLNEALQCDAILLATMLHPSYRLSIFHRRFFDHHLSAKRLLEERFKQRQDELQSETGFTQTPPRLAITTPAPKHRRVAEEEYFPATDEPQADEELTTYLGGKYRLPADQADELLHWWKVSPLQSGMVDDD
ncbi:hypothetical protein PSTG_05822 [Puccinia striiformis f. sp. tritici PST-78]|uniref:HAT C-terminal dimerisation domain-containing protein n=1 Tax=Puccinia striiformis f. sp. tritici PST-78 TaxID=1165861 RepID=A0A0L0VPJ3_9BASI|nr:hypothetical protein PSTG_05822 [Puccinia striiformis f. sp. tritici PST-78]